MPAGGDQTTAVTAVCDQTTDLNAVGDQTTALTAVSKLLLCLL